MVDCKKQIKTLAKKYGWQINYQDFLINFYKNNQKVLSKPIIKNALSQKQFKDKYYWYNRQIIKESEKRGILIHHFNKRVQTLNKKYKCNLSPYKKP